MQTKFRRSLASVNKEKLSDTVEIDEWFYGGVAVGGNAFTGKKLVIAALEVDPRGKGYERLRLGIIETARWRHCGSSFAPPSNLARTSSQTVWRRMGKRWRLHARAA